MDERKFFKKEWWKIVWFFPKLKDWNYEIIEIKENRSLAQNNLYFWYLNNIKKAFDDIGVYEGLRDKLIPWKYKKNCITWKRLVKRKSTTKLTKKEFSNYIKDIEKYLYQTYEITAPLPTDNLVFNW